MKEDVSFAGYLITGKNQISGMHCGVKTVLGNIRSNEISFPCAGNIYPAAGAVVREDACMPYDTFVGSKKNTRKLITHP